MLALQAQQDSLYGVGFAHAVEYRTISLCGTNFSLLTFRQEAKVLRSSCCMLSIGL
jgi:hypothetical protein